MRANLTDVFVQSVKAPERGQAEYWDRKERGLGLRVSQGGRRTWTLLYRLPTDGRLRRFTLGTYPVLSLKDARENLEREMIRNALRKHAGKIGLAAGELGVSRPTLYDLMDRLGISRE